MERNKFYKIGIISFAALAITSVSSYALNEYLKSKRGVRGDFSPSKERKRKKQAHDPKKTVKSTSNKEEKS